MNRPGTDDAHFAALGRVTATSTLMEDRIHLLTWGLISGDQIVGQIVTAQLGFRNLVPLTLALARHRIGPESPLFTDLESLLGRAENAQQRRNDLVHSVWGDDLGVEGRRRIKRTARAKGLKWEFRAVSPAEMNELASTFEALAYECDELNRRISEQLRQQR